MAELITIFKLKTTYKVHENIQLIQTSTPSLLVTEIFLKLPRDQATKKTTGTREIRH